MSTAPPQSAAPVERGLPVQSGAPRELRRISGPSALGGGWRRFLNLTWVVASTDFRLTYFGSVLGYLWSFTQPLLFFGVLYVIFGVILRKSFAATVHDFPVLLLFNIVLYNFFAGATTGAVPSIVQRENLVRKMHFPRLVIPLAVVSTNLIQLALNLVTVILFMLIYGIEPRVTWLLLPVIVFVLAAFTAGCAMLLSALYVRYRDVAPIWAVVSQALFYATPVFITIEKIEGHGSTVTRLYLFNPLAAIFQQARHWMLGSSPSTSAVMGGLEWALVPIAILLAVIALGFWVFNREAPRIAEEL